MKTVLSSFAVLLSSMALIGPAIAGEGANAKESLNNGAVEAQSSSYSDADILSKRLLTIETLEGHFQQTLMADDGELLQESEGRFALNKKGQYRWETTLPFAQLLIGDKEYLQLYDPDLEQLNRRRLSEAERQTPLFILSSQELSLAENYRVEKRDDGFQLSPKTPSSSFVTMDLRFENGLPSEIVVLDSLGQKTHIRLLETKANSDLEASQFEFDVPPGTDIIDEG